MSLAFDESNAILSIQNRCRAAVRFKHRWRAGKPLKCSAGFLATGAIANDACYRCADGRESHAATGAPNIHSGHRSAGHRELLPVVGGQNTRQMLMGLNEM